MFPDSDPRPMGGELGDFDSDRAWRFAQLIRGSEIYGRTQAESEANAERRQLEYLAQFSARHAEELRALRSTEVKAAGPRATFSSGWLKPSARRNMGFEQTSPRRRRAERRLVRFDGRRRPKQRGPAPHASSSGLTGATRPSQASTSSCAPTHQYQTQSAMPLPGSPEHDAPLFSSPPQSRKCRA